MKAEEFAAKIKEFSVKPGWGIEEIDAAISGLKLAMTDHDVELTRIRAQLDHAKAERKETGMLADQHWFVNATAALRHKGRQRQTMQAVMSDLSKRRKEINRKLYERMRERRFVAAARAVLPHETYERIWNEVKRLEGEEEIAA